MLWVYRGKLTQPEKMHAKREKSEGQPHGENDVLGMKYMG